MNRWRRVASQIDSFWLNWFARISDFRSWISSSFSARIVNGIVTVGQNKYIQKAENAYHMIWRIDIVYYIFNFSLSINGSGWKRLFFPTVVYLFFVLSLCASTFFPFFFFAHFICWIHFFVCSLQLLFIWWKWQKLFHQKHI